MPATADSFDLGRLRLTAGEGRRLELEVRVDALEFGGERYEVAPRSAPVTLDLSRTTGDGYALRLRFEVAVDGPCMRCLEGAAPTFAVDVREVHVPGGGEELESPYLEEGVLDLRGWARDALALRIGDAPILCRDDCAGLCPVCGENLNEAPPGHAHERAPDPRWAKLRELKLD